MEMGTNELLWVRAGAVSSTWAASVHQLETWFGAQEEILAGGIGLCLVYVGRVTRAARGRGQASPGGDSRASKEEDLRLKARKPPHLSFKWTSQQGGCRVVLVISSGNICSKTTTCSW